MVHSEESNNYFASNSGKNQASSWMAKATTLHAITITWQMHQARE